MMPKQATRWTCVRCLSTEAVAHEHDTRIMDSLLITCNGISTWPKKRSQQQSQWCSLNYKVNINKSIYEFMGYSYNRAPLFSSFFLVSWRHLHCWMSQFSRHFNALHFIFNISPLNGTKIFMDGQEREAKEIIIHWTVCRDKKCSTTCGYKFAPPDAVMNARHAINFNKC